MDASDLNGMASLMRTHIEIRNRSWMTMVHRDCFIGSDAIDFLVTQGFCDSRKEAVEIARKMVISKFIAPCTGKRRKFQDAYFYYRFREDEVEGSELAPTNAGNGQGLFLGHGGCKFSFCPHTAHNSYILDIALADGLQQIKCRHAHVPMVHPSFLAIAYRVFTVFQLIALQMAFTYSARLLRYFK